MKTAISLPKELFDKAEVAAKKLNLSRSRFYADAIARRLEELEHTKVAARVNEAIARYGQPGDSDFAEANRQRLRRATKKERW